MIAKLPRFRDTDQIGRRLAMMYRGTVFGMKMWLLYDLRCPRELVAHYVATNTGYAFASPHGPCSQSYYDRKALTPYERDRREIEARKERGEQFNRLMRRQA